MKVSLKKSFGLGVLAFAPYPIMLVMQAFFANALSVEEVGIFASISIFCSVILAVTNWGTDKYIISKKNIENEEIDEVFSFEFFYCLFGYLLTLIFLRNYANEVIGLQNSKIFEYPNLNVFWAAIGFVFFYNPLSKSKAILEKKLRYFEAYIPLLCANIIGGIFGVGLFLTGFGVWSMILWRLSVYLIEMIILLLISPYRPKIHFKFLKKPDFLSYCLPFFLAGLLSFIILNADYIMVRKLLGPKELALYWMAFSVSHILIAFREIISRFLLPALSRLHEDQQKIILFGKINAALQLLAVIVVIVVTFWSDYGFVFVFGEKWSDAVPLFIVLVYAALLKLLAGLSGPLLFSLMNTRVNLNISLLNAVILVPIVYISIIIGGLFGAVIGVLVSQIILTVYAFQTGVKNVTGLGVLSYFSYLTINIIICASLYFLALQFLGEIGVLARVYLTLFTIVFAVVSFRWSNIFKYLSDGVTYLKDIH